MKQSLITLAFLCFSFAVFSQAIYHPFSIQNSEYSDTARAQILPVKGVQINVEKSGTYMLFANIGLSMPGSNDASITGKVFNSSFPDKPILDFVVVTKNHNNDIVHFGESSSWNIVRLNKGDTITLKYLLAAWVNNPDNNTYEIKNGRIGLIKLK